MILTGQEAFNEIVKVVSHAHNFCYILTPWFGPEIARAIKRVLKVENCVVVVRDYWKGNKQCCRIFKDFQFLINPRLHSKIIITEQAGIEGSTNFTKKAFDRNADHTTFFQADEPNYDQLMQIAMDWIAEAIPFDYTQPTVYWNNQDRPLEELPNVLEESDQDIVESSDADPEDLALGESNETPSSKDEREQVRANVSEAWRIFSGQKKKHSA